MLDGPFVEAKEVIAGYLVIEADSLDEAVKTAAECPRHPWVGRTALGLGAVPFAALTWWTLVTPLVAVLAIGCGLLAT